MYPLQKCLQQTFFIELCVKISLLRSNPEKKYITVCNALYFRLCIDLMHILPPVTAEGFDGSRHPRFAECRLYLSVPIYKIAQCEVQMYSRSYKNVQVILRLSRCGYNGRAHVQIRVEKVGGGRAVNIIWEISAIWFTHIVVGLGSLSYFEYLSPNQCVICH